MSARHRGPLRRPRQCRRRWTPSARRSKAARPDAILVAGDLAMNGPSPAATVDGLRELEADGALDRPGQHRRRRRRLRLRGRLPVVPGRRPRRDPLRPPSGRTMRSATSGSTGCAACRRSGGSGPTTRSSSSATRRPARRPPASTATSTRRSCVERVSRDRRPGHLLRPHPHARGPRPRLEADRQRRLRGLRVRRRPDRLVGPHRRSTATTSRPRSGGPTFDALTVAQRDHGARPARRRLPRGDRPHREARPMTGRAGRAPRRRHRAWGAVTPSATTSPRPGTAWSPVGPGSATIEAFDPSRLDRRGSRPRSATSTRAMSSTARTLRRTDRYIQSRARRGARGDGPGGPAGAARGRAGRGHRRDPRDRPRRRRHALRQASRPTPSAGRTGSARSSSRWASPTSGPARSRSASGRPRAELRDRRPPARPAATPSARRGRRSAAATPT